MALPSKPEPAPGEPGSVQNPVPDHAPVSAVEAAPAASVVAAAAAAPVTSSGGGSSSPGAALLSAPVASAVGGTLEVPPVSGSTGTTASGGSIFSGLEGSSLSMSYPSNGWYIVPSAANEYGTGVAQSDDVKIEMAGEYQWGWYFV